MTPELLLWAYAAGIFPMASARDSLDVHWIDPPFRGVFPINSFRVSRSLRRHILNDDYIVRTNHDFAGTMRACAARPETWINTSIFSAFQKLHQTGHAHSLEIWSGHQMVGGVYGLAIGSAFFGESMFSHRRDASKIALAWLMHRMKAGGFTLFDTQFLTDHLASLGAIEITKADYLGRLNNAIGQSAQFIPDNYHPTRKDVSS